MTNIPLYTAIGLVAISLAARAEDLSTATAPLPPGTFTTSAHSDEWKIANALSADERRRLTSLIRDSRDFLSRLR